MSPSPSTHRSEGAEERSPREGPIGIFDSGVGGLSIMRELAHELPYEDIIYFADTAHYPLSLMRITSVRSLEQTLQIVVLPP